MQRLQKQNSCGWLMMHIYAPNAPSPHLQLAGCSPRPLLPRINWQEASSWHPPWGNGSAPPSLRQTLNGVTLRAYWNLVHLFKLSDFSPTSLWYLIAWDSFPVKACDFLCRWRRWSTPSMFWLRLRCRHGGCLWSWLWSLDMKELAA